MTPDRDHQPSTRSIGEGGWRGACTCGWRAADIHRNDRARETAFRDAQDHTAITASITNGAGRAAR